MDGRYDRAVLAGQIECQNYHPTQNCSHDRHIRLHVDGMDWQVGEVGTQLRKLTRLPERCKDNSGDVTVPLTWAMVTQISGLMQENGYGWRPDPGLNKWIETEFLRRHSEYGSPSNLMFDVSSPDWAPMPHQLAGAYVGALNERFFFCDDMRTGKTRTALLTMAELEARGKNPFPAFVITPASVVDPWLEELEAAFPDWPATEYRGPKRRNLSSRYKVYVMSWQTFTRDMKHERELPPLLRFLMPQTVVYDEAHALCLSHASCINTPSGPKMISEIREGDTVLGVDHTTGLDVWTRVNKVGRSPLRETITLGGLELTPDHPVWVSDSNCMWHASSYDENPSLRSVRDFVQPESFSKPAGAEVLLPKVRKRKEGRGDGGRSFTLGNSGSGSGGPAQPGEVTHSSGNAGVPGVGSQPVQRTAGRGDQESVYGSEQEAWVSGADGRERGAYYPAGAVAEAARLGVHPRVLSRPGSTATGLPDMLQGGSRLRSAEAGSGAGREQPQGEIPAGARPEEGREALVTWLDGDEVLEYGSPEESLWNLSTDTGNYVAAGILVHNCNTKTKQSVAAKQIARVTPYVFPMSGTPITRDVGGFWTAMSVLDIRSFPDENRYKERYTDRTPGDYADKISGIHKGNLAEFRLLTQGSMRRIAKADVNPDLPPVSYSTRAVDVPQAYRAAYDEMADDMIAHLPDVIEPMQVMGVLTQLQRLTQLASSACDVDKEMVIDESVRSPTFGELVPRYTITMREPSWKVDELMAILEENQGTGNPLLVFSTHTQLVKLAGARAEREGYRTGYITGKETSKRKKTHRLAYQAGELDLMCCNVTAGGVGLTLNRGDTIVMLEPSWAYWQRGQAESRADDIMGAKQVHVIDIVARNTVESRIRQALKDKSRQLSELVRDPRIVTSFLNGQPIHVK